MCVIAWAWRAHPRYRLVVLANRDERHARPAEPLHWWADAPEVLAGRDAEAGGTWLGASRSGRFAALTNRPGPPPAGAPSRGELAAGFLASSAGAVAAASLLAARADAYAGFNLLLVDAEALAFVSNREPPRALDAGVYGMANGALDERSPKVRQLVARLAAWAGGGGEPAEREWFAWLADDAPAPGGGAASAIFVRGAEYGTRASSVVTLAADGAGRIAERRFDAAGRMTDESAQTWEAGP